MTQKSTPDVSVILPVYNAEKYLRECLDSVLRQTYTDFEVVIVNDGSTDGSQKIIDQYSEFDSRIVSVKQKNQGVVKAANKAISTARGKYIARMDADDVAMSDRLKQQHSILENHKDTVLVCSSFETMSADGEYRYREIVPPDNETLKRSLYLRNPIANGSTMVRKSTLEDVGLFDEIFAEDFHMWMKLADKGDFEGTGTTLYRWRMNPSGLTLSNNELSMEKSKLYISELWKKQKPSAVPRREITKKYEYYKKNHQKKAELYYGVYLNDLSQLAAKLFTSGHLVPGVRQILAVATSKKGFKVALNRIHLISLGHYTKLRKRVPFGQVAFDERY